tara:strand:- start:369 stop:749 length:381 start_codon:yes stop_codon:yes gene_type:complete
MKRILFLLIAAGLQSTQGSLANELNYDGLLEYTSNQAETMNYSNIISTDWAFKSIKNLANNRDCNLITRKSDSVSSRKGFNRYEAALIIRRCLQDKNNLSAEEKRLLDEFKQELNSIKDMFLEDSN